MELEKKVLSGMLETAVVAARLAGQTAMEEQGYIKVMVKNGNELVTQADSKCQRIIVDRIKEAYPDHGFLAEEGVDGGIFKQQPRGAEEFWWVIDPIDGTNNFAHGVLLFVVSIAVMYEGEAVVGVIFDPATDSMYTAVKGGDAQLNGRKMSVSDDGIGEFVSIALDSHFEGGVPGWVSTVIERTRYRNLGTTALHLAYLAKGGLAAAVLNDPKLWDIAAGVMIAEAAGAVVTDWNGGKLSPVDMASYERAPFKVIAANKKTHGELVEIIGASS